MIIKVLVQIIPTSDYFLQLHFLKCNFWLKDHKHFCSFCSYTARLFAGIYFQFIGKGSFPEISLDTWTLAPFVLIYVSHLFVGELRKLLNLFIQSVKGVQAITLQSLQYLVGAGYLVFRCHSEFNCAYLLCFTWMWTTASWFVSLCTFYSILVDSPNCIFSIYTHTSNYMNSFVMWRLYCSVPWW